MNDITPPTRAEDGASQKTPNLMIPGAIVIAGVLIAVAIIFSGPSTGGVKAKEEPVVALAKGSKADNLRPVSADEHILGSPTAKVFVVEYSDTECPFCKNFHQTMHQIMEEYGKDGRVAWVYRQFPLLSIHPKAEKEALATECVAEIAGNGKFWEYLDLIFKNTPANNGLDPAKLYDFAREININQANFESCLASNRHVGKVEADLQNGIASGVTGTPYTFVVNSRGDKYLINGALPYSRVKQVIDAALGSELFE